MIGLVLAAGAGRRLRPHTDALPKALVPVDGDLTIMDVSLRNLAAAGLGEVTIVVGYRADAVAERVPEFQETYDVKISLVYNEKAEEWNNAYSLWLARDHFAQGALMVNGDTVHPVSVEHTLLAHRGPSVLLAIDDLKKVADEEMKTAFDSAGQLTRITKLMAPADAFGEYIGAAIIEPPAAGALADALKATWKRDPNLYYEDGFLEYAKRGGEVRAATIGRVEWVEVDNHVDLARARDIACRY